jgi:hypothetical protein
MGAGAFFKLLLINIQCTMMYICTYICVNGPVMFHSLSDLYVFYSLFQYNDPVWSGKRVPAPPPRHPPVHQRGSSSIRNRSTVLPNIKNYK